MEQIGIFEKKELRKRAKTKGVEKTIYFSKLTCTDRTEYTIDGKSIIVNVKEIVNRAFNKKNANFTTKGKEDYFEFKYDEQVYHISVAQDDNGYFGRITTEKAHKDIFEEYEVGKGLYQEIIIKSFTFFYINFQKSSLVYIGNKNLKNFNEIMQNYFEKLGKNNVFLTAYTQKELLEKIHRSNKLKKITAKVVPNKKMFREIQQVVGFDMAINYLTIQVDIKGITAEQVQKIVQKKSKTKDVINPILDYEDEHYKKGMIKLFEDILSIKDKIELTDAKDFSNIKSKLIEADNRYIHF